MVKRVIPEGRTLCGLCSRLRRGALYRFAAENGITKIALGHHRDDIVETLFLNLFFGGRLKAMAPKLLSDDGRHVVIRPLAYVAERDIARYARGRGFPLIPCKLCGSQDNLQRVAVKQMLAQWEREFPGRTESIFSALRHVELEHLADTAPLRLRRTGRQARSRLRARGAHEPGGGGRDRRPPPGGSRLSGPPHGRIALVTSAQVPLPNSYWVLPGQLLAGEHPAGSAPEATRARLQSLLAAGIECFFDLTQPGEIGRRSPYERELPAGIEYARAPLIDHAVPKERAQMAAILAALSRALGSGRLVYLHCRAGIGRTGMVAGCLLVERGMTGDEALAELNRLWLQSARSSEWPGVPGNSGADALRPHLGAAACRGRIGPAARARDARCGARAAGALSRGAGRSRRGRRRRRRHPVRTPGPLRAGRRHARRRPLRPAARRLERRYRHGAVSGREPAREQRLRCARPGRALPPLAEPGLPVGDRAMRRHHGRCRASRSRSRSGAASHSPARTTRTRRTRRPCRGSPR